MSTGSERKYFVFACLVMLVFFLLIRFTQFWYHELCILPDGRPVV
jgi:hypothetical protein